MSNKLDVTIGISADASGVEAGVGKATKSLRSLGGSAKKVAQDVGSMGDGSDKAAKKVARDTKSMERSLQSLLAKLEGGSRESRGYWEKMAEFKGVDKNALSPLLNQLDAARKKTDDAKKSAEGFAGGLASMKTAVAGFAAALGGSAVFARFIAETKAAEQEQAQLAAVLKSTGEAAGWSQAQLNKMADTLASKSTYSSGAINEAQTRLLSYTNIAGKEFPRAMQSVIDMSARMGMDVKSSAETIGRALDIPSEGLTALTRQGFRFTEEQKNMVKAMEETGRTGEAQAIILEALESSYGGAAEAARNTFGGALADLQNNISSLMTGGDGSVSGLTVATNTLSASVKDLDAILKALSQTSAESKEHTGSLKTVQEGLAVVFETVAVAGLTVKDTLVGVGREVGALAAQAAALARLDFKGFATIGDLAKEDAEKARAEWESAVNAILTARTRVAESAPLENPADAGSHKKTVIDLNSVAAAALNATSSFKSKAEQMAEVREQGNKLRAALKQLEEAEKGTSKEAEQLRERLKGVDERLASMGKSGAAGAAGLKNVESAYATLSKRVNEYISQLALEAKQGDKVTAAQKLQIQLDDLLVKSKGKVTAAKVASLKADIQTARAMEEEAKAVKRAVEAYQDYIRDQEAIARADVELSKAKEALWKSIADQNIELENQSRMLELEASNIGKSAYERTLANEVLRAQIELEKELRAISNNQTLDVSAKDEAEAAARARAAKKIALAERKAYVTEWEKTSQTIEDTLADHIMGGGKDAAQYLKRLFSTLVLQPVVQTVVGGIMGTGPDGVAGIASGGGGIGGLLNTASNIKTLMGLSGSGAALGSLGVSNAVGMAGGDALGALISTNATNWGVTAGSSLLGTIGAALPWISGGLAIASLLGGDLFKKSTPHMGASAVYKGGEVSRGWMPAGQFQEEMFTAIGGIAQSIGSALDATAESFGKKAGYTLSTVFSDDASKDNAFGGLSIIGPDGQTIADWSGFDQKWGGKRFSDGEAGYKEYLAALTEDVKTAFMAMDLPGWSDQLIEAATDLDSLNQALQGVSSIKASFDALGRSMEMFSGISGELQTALLETSGSMDTLLAGANAFYQGFYSEQERLEALQKQLRDTLTGFDLSIDPAMGDEAKEQFRATVEAAMAGGQGELASQLLAMSGSFATAADAAQKSAEDAAQAAQEAAQAIAQQWMDLENRVLAVQDKYRTPEQRLSAQYESIAGGLISAGLSNMQQGDLSSMLMQSSKDEIYALAQEVWNLGHLSIEARNALLDAADALADLKDAAKQQRDGLMSTLWQMTGNTQALREKELAALDPANRALQAMIYALGDLQNAAADAAQKTQAAWSSWSSASGMALQYTGDTSGVQAQAAILQAQISSAGVVDTAKLQELIGIEQALFNVQKQKQEEAQRLQSQITQERLNGLRDELAAARALADAAKRLGDYAHDLFSSSASGLSDSDRMAALAAEYGTLKDSARAGNVDAFGRLQSVTGDYLGLASTMAANGSEYSITAGRMAAELEALAKAQELVGQSQATGIEAQMKQLTAQTQIAQEQFEVSSTVQALIAKSMQEQADIWAREQAQASSLNAMQERLILQISSLPLDFGETMSPMLVNAASSIERPITERLDILIAAVYQGYSANSEGVRVPAYAVGTNVVPRDMLAQIHEGEAIIPKAFNPWAGGVGMNGGQGISPDVLAEIRALRKQNALLQALLQSIERSNQQLAQQFDAVTAGGNAMATEVMA